MRAARKSPLVEINEQLSQVGRCPLHVIGDFEVEIGRMIAAELKSFQVRKREDCACNKQNHLVIRNFEVEIGCVITSELE